MQLQNGLPALFGYSRFVCFSPKNFLERARHDQRCSCPPSLWPWLSIPQTFWSATFTFKYVPCEFGLKHAQKCVCHLSFLNCDLKTSMLRSMLTPPKWFSACIVSQIKTFRLPFFEEDITLGITPMFFIHCRFNCSSFFNFLLSISTLTICEHTFGYIITSLPVFFLSFKIRCCCVVQASLEFSI